MSAKTVAAWRRRLREDALIASGHGVRIGDIFHRAEVIPVCTCGKLGCEEHRPPVKRDA